MCTVGRNPEVNQPMTKSADLLLVFVATFVLMPSAVLAQAVLLPPQEQTASGTKEPAPPPYKILRYDEDYRYLKDPSRRSDIGDAIKYIPLCGREDWYLSIGGEARLRYEFYHNEDFGAATANSRGNNGYLLERYLLHGDLHLGPNIRFFGQFMTGLEDGRIGGPHPDVDLNRFDIHQAFVDVVLPLSGENDSVTARLGRQEMT